MSIRICANPECNKEFIPSHHKQTFCSKSCFKSCRSKYMKKYNREWSRMVRHNFRLEVEEKIGNKCIICGSQEKLTFHEINGKPHYPNVKGGVRLVEKYYLDNYQNFVPLCREHHLLIHHLADCLHSEADLEKVVEFIKKLIFLE